MDLLDIASNINKTHQGRISTLAGSSVLFSGAHLSTRGALHAFLRGESRRARGSGFSAKFFNLVCSEAQHYHLCSGAVLTIPSAQVFKPVKDCRRHIRAFKYCFNKKFANRCDCTESVRFICQSTNFLLLMHIIS